MKRKAQQDESDLLLAGQSIAYAALRAAFVAGAQWRRPLTWASDVHRAEAEALRRWPE